MFVHFRPALKKPDNPLVCYRFYPAQHDVGREREGRKDFNGSVEGVDEVEVAEGGEVEVVEGGGEVEVVVYYASKCPDSANFLHHQVSGFIGLEF